MKNILKKIKFKNKFNNAKKFKISFFQLIILIFIPTLIMSTVCGMLVYKRLSHTGKVTTTNNKYVNEFINTYIYYYNTIEQWKKVELGECWNLNVPTKIVHCIDDEGVEVEIEV